jgi:short-chain Z-isoprenyl diphosphate synthase
MHPIKATKSAIKKLIKAVIYPFYEKRLLKKLEGADIPRHIGVAVDGNRRWSKENPSSDGDISTARGHRAGADKIFDLLQWAEESHVEVVTIWLLSNQNLNRSADELVNLLQIIGDFVENLAAKKRWKINAVGSLELLPAELKSRIDSALAASATSTGMIVNVAIGYGGRNEIVDAVKSLILDEAKQGKTSTQIAQDLEAEKISQYLYTAHLPDPDLLIRTSGEQRLGGFMLWQSANSELYFCDAYWPDFRHIDFLRALRSYSLRHRRFGL